MIIFKSTVFSSSWLPWKPDGSSENLVIKNVHSFNMLSWSFGSTLWSCFCGIIEFERLKGVIMQETRFHTHSSLTDSALIHCADFLNMYNTGSFAFGFHQMMKLILVKPGFSSHRCWGPACLLHIWPSPNQLCHEIFTKLKLGTLWPDMGGGSLLHNKCIQTTLLEAVIK